MSDTLVAPGEARPVNDGQTDHLFLIEELEDARRTGALEESNYNALRTVADWIRTFVVQPNVSLGRAGPVCPFTPVALDQGTLWLAAERSEGKSKPELIQLIQDYQRRLLANPPLDGEAAILKSMVIVFTDLPAARAKDFIGGALEQISVQSYVDHGLVMGPFYKGNDGSAIYNSNFRPFTSPVSFLLMRRAVLADWKFFLNTEDWFRRWADRYGEAATAALADEMRRLPWNVRRD